MKIRSLPQALKEIKARDPETAITEYSLRKWVESGALPSSRSGRCILIDVDMLFERLQEGVK